METDNTPYEAVGSEGLISRTVKRVKSLKRFFISRKNYLRLLMILFVITITTTIFVFRDHVSDLEEYGYLGAFLVALITGATIILPVPGIAVIFALGAIYNPVLIGLAAGAGSALGELSGYMAGYSGQTIFENSRYYQRLEGWMKRRGSIVIFILAFVPNPFFDVAGAIAGALRFPLWKFLIVCFLGKTPRNMLVAFAGAYTLEWVLDLFEKYF